MLRSQFEGLVRGGPANNQHWFAVMENPATQKIVPEDWDDFVQFVNQYRDEIADDRFDLRIETDWARDLTEEDLLLLALLVKDADSYVSAEAKRNPNAPTTGFFARLFKR